MQTTRRELLSSAALFGASLFFAKAISACSAGGHSEEGTAASGDALVTCDPPVIGMNHGHVLVVPMEDVTSGATKTYSIKGTALHDHAVTLTFEHFATLAAGGTVSTVSSRTGTHSHPITVTCAATVESADGGAADATAG
jgi:hypothetical protein